MKNQPTSEREALDHLLTRLVGRASSAGNTLTLLRDSREHEAATLALIAQANHTIALENYLIDDDDWGRSLLSALCQAAERGVRVAVLCDWLGSWRLSRHWRNTLINAGGECRRFNVPGWGEPLAWVIRNHRKLLVTDSHTALITGWCHSARWRGQPATSAETATLPWRDTGVRIQGPVAAEAETAFAQTWALAGGNTWPSTAINSDKPLSSDDGSSRVRLIVGQPQSSPLFRLDQLMISQAKYRLWLTDAYPVGTPAYLDGLRRAAQAGVDVRLLVPGSSDLPWLGLLARSGYRALLEAGVRVFEWNGPMLHAKTAVIDGHWARVGSSNLNPASWLGNYELDVAIECAGFGAQMETQFLTDLDSATEIVLRPDQSVHLAQPRRRQRRHMPHQQSAVSTIRVSRAMALAVRESRRLGPADATALMLLGLIGLSIALLAFWRPAWVAWPLATISAWVSVNLLRIAWRRYQFHRQSGRARHKPAREEKSAKNPEET
ncbi:MAG: phospholipase D-like domain-containing protein [Pseudomonadota bacterium]